MPRGGAMAATTLPARLACSFLLVLTPLVRSKGNINSQRFSCQLLPHLSGHTLAFVLYCIATSPRVEAALLEELRANDLMTTPSTPSQAQWSYETLSKLPYLHAVVREAMRLLPVVPGIARDFDHDVSVDGYVLPRNTTIICSTFPAHINCWEDGEVYRPERWLDGGGVDGYDPSQHHPSKV